MNHFPLSWHEVVRLQGHVTHGTVYLSSTLTQFREMFQDIIVIQPNFFRARIRLLTM